MILAWSYDNQDNNTCQRITSKQQISSKEKEKAIALSTVRNICLCSSYTFKTASQYTSETTVYLTSKTAVYYTVTLSLPKSLYWRFLFLQRTVSKWFLAKWEMFTWSHLLHLTMHTNCGPCSSSPFTWWYFTLLNVKHEVVTVTVR